MKLKLINRIFLKKRYNFLNVVGLAIAFGVLIIVSLHVEKEFRGDQFQENYHSLVRLTRGDKVGTPIPLTNHFSDQFPEIEKYCRFLRMFDPIIKYDEQLLKLETGYFSDRSAFDIFTFDQLFGSINNDFSTPFSIALSESLSNKLFGPIDPVGKVIRYNSDFNFTVKAVFKDLPSNSHLQIDALASIASMEFMSEDEKYPYESFEQWGCMNYLQLAPNTSVPRLEMKLDSFVKKLLSSEQFSLRLQAFNEIYFDHKSGLDDCKHSNKKTLIVLLSIAFIIIILGVVNYINLTTAQVLSHYKEIAIKKILGASKFSLITQFLKESIAISVVAMFIGLVLAYFFHYLIVDLLPGDFFAEDIFRIKYQLLFWLLSILVGLLAGFYPAIYFSSVKERDILKGISLRTKGQGTLRKGLIITQFSASIVLITGTLFIYKQLTFFKNTDPGFPKEQLMYLAYNDVASSPRLSSFIEEISKNPNVISIAQTNTVPGNIFYQNIVNLNSEKKILYDLITDRQFFETMGLKLVKGRLPSINLEKAKNQIVLNRSAVKMLDWEEPLGRTDIWGREVVGIVEDFNYMSMHQPIFPLMIRFNPYYSYATIRLNTQFLNQSLAAIESSWNDFFPSSLFEYHFFDDSFDGLYNAEIKFGKLVGYLSIIALFISLLGMAGLVSFVSKRKSKEIGIRKICGATTSQILALLNKDFTKWVTIAYAIACPIVYYSISIWLQNFAYQTNLSWWVFALAGLLALGITLLTVSLQSYQAASRNPVESLRNE